MGLNVVIGLAGLLDLGYAAFFAIGAYTYAYSNSPFSGLDLPFCPMLFVGARRRRGLRHPARRADPAAARRLPRDHDPRLRRDRPDRLPEPRPVHRGHERDRRHLPAGGSLPVRSARSAPISPFAYLILMVVDRHVRDDLHVPVTGFPDRAGLERHPRGRAGGGGERHQHRHDEAARVRARRDDGRPGRCLQRLEADDRLARTSSCSRCRSRSWRWSSSAAWATSGASPPARSSST